MKRTRKKNEKRRHIRVQPDKKRPVEININGQNFLRILYANDISEGGIGIIVPEKFKGCKINNNVSLVITLPHPYKKIFLVTGRIIHVMNEKFGVEFLDLTKENRKILKKYINRRRTDNPEHKKAKRLRAFWILILSIGVFCFLIHGKQFYAPKSTANIQIPKKNKKNEKQTESKDKNTTLEVKEASQPTEIIPELNNEQISSTGNEMDYTDSHISTQDNNINPQENNTSPAQYDSVMISDIAGKKIKLRGGRWFFFHYNNTVGVSNDGSSDISYFYASNYYSTDNQIIMEISYEERIVITFSEGNIVTGKKCSFEKIVGEEQVSINKYKVIKIVDIN
ncbi:MAG: hypothetical protein OMM_08794 [Candidatus Magnetoglobus multicellularis str. Araruama]|uniref:PilZ domain-containing protein n=1 Tax=Candidatus Magnetoglobus multicellularis str. Araruama TaxID=890399 RepID=A0A1V1P6M2_9BACT|nr:MAG: hypothetical protein OMM_08794 [Candidatus Magnetoglobus multicellularis str. Araruama]